MNAELQTLRIRPRHPRIGVPRLRGLRFASLKLGVALMFLWLASGLRTEGTIVFQIGQNFRATTYGVDTQSQPADADGAIGPKHFVQVVNGRFSVYSKTNGLTVQSLSDRVFWSNAGVNASTQVEISDPRVIFDSDSQRWFVSSIDANPLNEVSNRVFIAVSDGVDPTQTWHGFVFPVDPVHGYFGDYPTMGIDANGVYLSADLYQNTTPRGAALFYIPKSSLTATPPTITGRQSFGVLAANNHGQVLQPAVTRGNPSSAEVILATKSIGLDFQSHSNLQAFSVQNGVLSTPASISIPPYTVPINPTQPDGTDTLDDGDARISGLVYRLDDVLYAIHGVQVDNRAALQWFKINATNFAVIQTGIIADELLEFFYGSIAVNSSGTVVICCNGCSVSDFIGSYAFIGETANGTLTFGQPILLQAGLTSYHNGDFGIGGTSRWGDYSATSVDPIDENRFWTIQMIPTDISIWTTQVTEIITGPLTLTAKLSSSARAIVLSWSSQASGFQLQFSPTLDSAARWTTVTQSPTLVGTQFIVSIPLTGAEGFFRLQRP